MISWDFAIRNRSLKKGELKASKLFPIEDFGK